MFANRTGNRRANEIFLVQGATDTALYNTAGGGNNIVNPSTHVVRLADKQIGAFAGTGYGSVAPNVALDTTPTITEAPQFYLAQGTAYSSNLNAYPGARYPLWNEPYVRSADIIAASGVRITKQLYAAPTTSTWVIGQPTGTAGEIAALDDTEYTIGITYQGRRHSEMYNEAALHHYDPYFVTPNYTTLATAEPVDHLIQNLTYDINRNSILLTLPRARKQGNEMVVAFAIDTTNSAGVNIDTLTAGSTVAVVNTPDGVRNITLTADQFLSLVTAVEAAGGDTVANLNWSILTIDPVTAGTTTGGVADMIILMAADWQTAYSDYIPQVKVRLGVGLKSGFDYAVVSHEQYTPAFEGSGLGRQMDLWYKATHGQRRYSLDHEEFPVIAFDSPFSTTTNYIVYNILHELNAQVDISSQISAPHRTIVALPTGSSNVTNFDNFMNAWLTSAALPNIITI